MSEVVVMKYLEHHGIKGQRWGVRRYQNEDGSLTEAGKKRRYGSVLVEKNDDDSYIVSKGNKSIKATAQSLHESEKMIDDMVRQKVADLAEIPVSKVDRFLIKNPDIQKAANELVDSSMEELLSDYIKKYGIDTPNSKVNGEIKKTSSEPKKVDSNKPKYTQKQAINKIYNDLEKKYPNFNSFSQDKQDRLFFDYANKSGLYEYI